MSNEYNLKDHFTGYMTVAPLLVEEKNTVENPYCNKILIDCLWYDRKKILPRFQNFVIFSFSKLDNIILVKFL